MSAADGLCLRPVQNPAWPFDPAPVSVEKLVPGSPGSLTVSGIAFASAAQSSVGGLSSKRASPPLTQTCLQQGLLAPRALPRFYAITGLSVFLPGHRAVMYSRATLTPFPPPRRISQASRLICPRALSPTTPEGLSVASTCCFPASLVRLHLCRQAGHLRFPIEAESGLLALRLTCSPPQFASPIAATRAGSPTCRTGNLHGELLSVH